MDLNTEIIGELKEKKAVFKINWNIVARASSRKPNGKHCNLCLKEKIAISKVRNHRTHMNERDELGDICRHRRRHFLINIKSDLQMEKDVRRQEKNKNKKKREAAKEQVKDNL